MRCQNCWKSACICENKFADENTRLTVKMQRDDLQRRLQFVDQQIEALMWECTGDQMFRLLQAKGKLREVMEMAGIMPEERLADVRAKVDLIIQMDKVVTA